MASPASALLLATISFMLSFAAWGLIGGLASVFTGLYNLTASETALLVAVPVLLGSLARLPMGMLTDQFGGRLVFTALLAFSSLSSFIVPMTGGYNSLLVAAFLIGMAGSSFAVGAAFVSRWTPAAKQGTALGVYGLGTLGQSLAVFIGPVVAARLGWQAVFQWTGAILLVWAVAYCVLARNAAQSTRPATVGEMVGLLRRAPKAWLCRMACRVRRTSRSGTPRSPRARQDPRRRPPARRIASPCAGCAAASSCCRSCSASR